MYVRFKFSIFELILQGNSALLYSISCIIEVVITRNFSFEIWVHRAVQIIQWISPVHCNILFEIFPLILTLFVQTKQMQFAVFHHIAAMMYNRISIKWTPLTLKSLNMNSQVDMSVFQNRECQEYFASIVWT